MLKRIVLSLVATFIAIAFLVAVFAKGDEIYILNNGQPLSARMIELATDIGIKNPTKIRTLEKVKIYGKDTIGGLTVGYGIYVKKGYTTESLICHELVHVKQYEDAGGVYKFLVKYINETSKVGYWDNKYEVEARVKAEIYTVMYNLEE